MKLLNIKQYKTIKKNAIACQHPTDETNVYNIILSEKNPNNIQIESYSIEEYNTLILEKNCICVNSTVFHKAYRIDYIPDISDELISFAKRAVKIRKYKTNKDE
jgi:hypothetical protein